MKIMAVKRVARAALAVITSTADSGRLTNDMYVADLDEEVDANSGAKAIDEWGFAETKDEAAMKEAAALCIPVG